MLHILGMSFIDSVNKLTLQTILYQNIILEIQKLRCEIYSVILNAIIDNQFFLGLNQGPLYGNPPLAHIK